MYCEACGELVGLRRGHWVAAGRVFCARCHGAPAAHRIAFPSCRRIGHEVTDHEGTILATASGAARLVT